MPRTHRMLVALPLVALLAPACSFLKAKSDPTQYFILTSSTAERATPPPTVTVGLERVELPEYLVRPELVTRSGSNQLRIAEYEVWGEPVKDGFARTLRRDLEKALGAKVIAAPFDPAAKPDLTVEVEVQRFERVAGEGAVLDARWTLRDNRKGVVLAHGSAHERQPLASDADTQSSVAALSRDVGALADEVTTAVHTDDRRRQEAARGNAR
jgi:uncharacterized lipoprotein YmbA